MPKPALMRDPMRCLAFLPAGAPDWHAAFARGGAGGQAQGRSRGQHLAAHLLLTRQAALPTLAGAHMGCMQTSSFCAYPLAGCYAGSVRLLPHAASLSLCGALL